MSKIDNPARANPPAAIKKLIDRESRGILTGAQTKKLAEWRKANPKKIDVTSQAAIGVPGARMTDPQGKFLGYTPGTYTTPTLPQNDLENQQLNAIAQYVAPPRSAPRYFSGEEFKPAGLPPQARSDLQQKLKAAHMYPASASVTYGVWDLSVDAPAYKVALANANAAGVDVDTWLEQKAQQPEETEPANPISISLTSPEEIKAVADKTAREIYGGFLPQDIIDQMVAEFHSKQTQAQTQQQLTSQYGGTGVDNVPLDNYIEEEIKKRYPEKVAATSFGEKMDTLLNVFTG